MKHRSDVIFGRPPGDPLPYFFSATLDEDETSKNLRSRVRLASVNFIKETLVGLPGIPTEDEFLKLQDERKNEAARRIEQEKKTAAAAKLKYEQRGTRLSVVTTGLPYYNRTSPKGR